MTEKKWTTPYARISKMERDVWLEIAQNSPIWLSKLAKIFEDKGKWSRGGVEKALERLCEKKLIEEVHAEQTPSGLKQVWYDATLFGIVAALTQEDTWEHIDKIAEKKASKLPLVFGKWNYFIDKDVRETLVKALIWALDDPMVTFYAGTWTKSSDSEISLRDRLTERVLFFSMDLTSGWSLDYQVPFTLKSIMILAEDWIPVLKGDEDLRKYLDKSLERFAEKYQENLNDIKLLEDLIAKPDAR
ncbi:MAG: hypothetical protein ABSE15_02875 [Candidatus Bathyarchaeia archaeon]